MELVSGRPKDWTALINTSIQGKTDKSDKFSLPFTPEFNSGSGLQYTRDKPNPRVKSTNDQQIKFKLTGKVRLQQLWWELQCIVKILQTVFTKESITQWKQIQNSWPHKNQNKVLKRHLFICFSFPSYLERWEVLSFKLYTVPGSSTVYPIYWDRHNNPKIPVASHFPWQNIPIHW